MFTELAVNFRKEMDRSYARLREVSPALADTPWKPDGWTRKQVMGHLLDSATNNRQRFVRAATQGEYHGPSYEQQAWVDAHGYAEQSWETLLNWFGVEHQILAAVVDRVPNERLETVCTVGSDAPVTLRFLIEDYVQHLLWHIDQVAGPPSLAGTKSE